MSPANSLLSNEGNSKDTLISDRSFQAIGIASIVSLTGLVYGALEYFLTESTEELLEQALEVKAEIENRHLTTLGNVWEVTAKTPEDYCEAILLENWGQDLSPLLCEFINDFNRIKYIKEELINRLTDLEEQCESMQEEDNQETLLLVQNLQLSLKDIRLLVSTLDVIKHHFTHHEGYFLAHKTIVTINNEFTNELALLQSEEFRQAKLQSLITKQASKSTTLFPLVMYEMKVSKHVEKLLHHQEKNGDLYLHQKEALAVLSERLKTLQVAIAADTKYKEDLAEYHVFLQNKKRLTPPKK